MKVKFLGNFDTLALEKDKVYNVISVEKGGYRIMSQQDECCLFSPQCFEIVEKTVYCPVKDGQIDGGDCMVVCDVADRYIKPSVLSSYGIEWDEGQREKCINCKWHEDIEE